MGQAGQTPAAVPASSSAPKPAHAKRKAKAAPATAEKVNVAVVAAPVVPPEPPAPHWPVNDPPTPATVTWNSQGLKVAAENASLAQILQDVATVTGTSVEGFEEDRRIYGAFGPGQARDVLSQLMQDSGYNVLMIGDLGQGAPRQLVLTLRKNGKIEKSSEKAAASDDDDDDQPAPPQSNPQPPPNRVPPQFGGDMRHTRANMPNGIQQPPMQPNQPQF
jgi:hypothetical protein